MTKEETIKIMAMLGAFYSGGKNDPKLQAHAWHMILYKYDYETAKNAVLRFAENDHREYATFPTVGKVVESIKEEEHIMLKPVNEVIKGISYGTEYSMLSDDAHLLMDEEAYKLWLKMNAEEFQQCVPAIRQNLLKARGLLTDGGNN